MTGPATMGSVITGLLPRRHAVRLAAAASSVWLTAAVCVTFVVGSEPNAAPGSGGEGVPGGERLELESIPQPPVELKRWLDAGDVRFVVGGEPPPAELWSDAEAAERDRPLPPARQRLGDRLGAETRYTIAFDYASRSRWRIRRSGGRRELVISVRFGRVRWEPSHVIWFKEAPPRESFWDSPLVRHELDHVRLSADRRLGRRFEAMLRQENVLRVALEDSVAVTPSFVRARVDEHVRETFGRVIDLIEIRYRELDRLTGHGVRPVGAETDVGGMLRASTDAPGQN